MFSNALADLYVIGLKSSLRRLIDSAMMACMLEDVERLVDLMQVTRKTLTELIAALCTSHGKVHRTNLWDSGLAQSVQTLCTDAASALRDQGIVSLPDTSEAYHSAKPSFRFGSLAPAASDLVLNGLPSLLTEHVLLFCGSADLTKICCTSLLFNGPVEPSPLRRLVLRAVKERYPHTPLAFAFGNRPWPAVLKFAEKVNERAKGWSASKLRKMLEKAIDDHENAGIGSEPKWNSKLIGESVRVGLASISVALSGSIGQDVRLQAVAAQFWNTLFVHFPHMCAWPLAAGAHHSLVKILASGDDEAKWSAVHALAGLAAKSYENCVELAAAGALLPLVRLLQYRCPESGMDLRPLAIGVLSDMCADDNICAEILAAGAVSLLIVLLDENFQVHRVTKLLLGFFVRHKHNKVKKRKNGDLVIRLSLRHGDWIGLARTQPVLPLVRVLKQGASESRLIAAAALSMLYDDQGGSIEAEILATNTMPHLLSLLQANSTAEDDGVEHPLSIIFSSASGSFINTLLTAGVLQPLLSSLRHNTLQGSTVEVMKTLALRSEFSAFVAEGGAIPGLVTMVHADSMQRKVDALHLLWNSSDTNVVARKAIQATVASVLPHVLQVLRDGTEATDKTPAVAMLKIFILDDLIARRYAVDQGSVALLQDLLQKSASEDTKSLVVFALWLLSSIDQSLLPVLRSSYSLLSRLQQHPPVLSEFELSPGDAEAIREAVASLSSADA
jgi:hypothetical protein